MSLDFSRLLRRVVTSMTRAAAHELTKPTPRRADDHSRSSRRNGGEPARQAPRRGGVTTRDEIRYAPSRNGAPDPGEVVWAWVPYEDDPSRGKDRPVLVLDVDGDTVHALQMTSRDHDRDAAAEARAGRYWMDVGAGAWDSKGRPSEVRLNRLLTLDASSVRREGAALERALFERVVTASREHL